jgi:hypothetical protein
MSFKQELLGDFVSVPDEVYLEWLNDKIQTYYETDWESSPIAQAQLDFFEEEYAECAYRLGISGRLR